MKLREEFNESPDGPGDWIVAISNDSEWGDYKMDEWRDIEWQGRPALPFFGPISECPAEVLDLEYGTGFGSPSRPMWRLWSTNFVLFGTEYDGSTGLDYLPRNPTGYTLEAQ